MLTMGSVAQAIVDRKTWRTDALNDEAWTVSEWISVVDAPIVTGRVNDGDCSAPGASWFVTSLKNQKKVDYLLLLQ